MGVLQKRFASKKKKASAADFGAALARAREEADHIFKQACQDEIQNFSTSNSARFIGSPPAVFPSAAANDLKAASPRSKAAAWAWYQRNGGSNTGVNPEEVRNRALVVVKRSSRFKAEALRVNGSYTADDTIIKAEQKWDPNKSLFDSFELLCVAKELDKALQQQHGLEKHEAPLPFPGAKPFSKPPRDAPKSHLVSLSCSSPSLLKRASTARLTRFIPAPILCISEEDIATSKASLSKKSSDLSSVSGSSNSSKMLKRGSSMGSSALGRISKVIHLLNNISPPSTKLQPQEEPGGDEDDESSLHHHRHEHFHHHHHHHHHHGN